MDKLTKKQAEFVRNKVAGATNEDAAVAAGYAPASAKIAASRLMRHAGVRAAIKAAGVTIGKNTTGAMMGKVFGSSLAFMQSAYNDTTLPLGVRLEAAKQALPYEHAKMGEVGKKQAAKDNAGEIARGGGRFATKQPPPTRVVVPFKK